MKLLDLWEQITDDGQRIFAVFIRRFTTDRIPHLRVSQSRMRVHDGRVKLRLAGDALLVDFHVADEAQTINLRLQRTNAIAQNFRQHRHHKSRKIHRRRTQLRFIIECTSRRYVMRNIRDRDDETIATARQRFAINRIVKILRILTINRHQLHLAQINTIGNLCSRDLDRNRFGFLNHRRRKFVRNVVTMNRGFDGQRCGEFVTEDCHNFANRWAPFVGHLSQFGDDELSVAGIHFGIRWNHDVALDALVIRHHIRNAIFLNQRPDQALHAALEDVDDFALLTPTAVHPGDVDQHAVAVHHLPHFIRRQKHIILHPTPRIRSEEAEAVRIRDHAARN